MDKTCRVCLTTSQDVRYYSLLSVFPEFKRKSLCVLDLLSAVTSSQVELSNNLPSKICSECVKSLRSAYNFISLFNSSQNSLLKNIQEDVNFGNAVQKKDPPQANVVNRSLKPAEEQNNSNEERIIIITETENENDLENEKENHSENDYTVNSDADYDDDDDDDASDNVETEPREAENTTDDEQNKDHVSDSSSEGSDEQEIDKEEEKSANTDVGQGDMFSENIDEEIMKMEDNILDKSKPFEDEEPQIVNCKFCGKMFSGVAGSIARRNLLRHILTQHEDNQKKLLTLACEICDKVYTGFDARRKFQRLKRHMKKEHPLEEVKIPETMLQGLDEIKVEIKEEDETAEAPPEKIRCDLCGKLFNSNNNLWYHRYRCSTRVKKNECKVCKAVFKNYNALRYHRAAKHEGGNQFPCSICKKKFFSPSTLRAHVNAVHEKAAPVRFLCSLCGKGFKYTTALKYHLAKQHTNRKDNKCEYCGARFILLGELRTHERNHTGERPYVCKVCKKAFKRSTEKNRHEKIHAGIYSHSCEYCSGKVFSSKYSMKIHWLQHAGDFKCTMCPKGFLSEEILTFHYSHRHKIRDVYV